MRDIARSIHVALGLLIGGCDGAHDADPGGLGGNLADDTGSDVQGKIIGLDSSSDIPTNAQLTQAKAAGIRLWMGYLPLPGAAHGWAESDFQRIKAASLGTVAFAFGTADPVQAKQMAAAWGVRLCLDVEDAARGDGSWVDGWLAASGAGLYGNKPVLVGHRGHMPFAIMSAYPGYDPGTNDPGIGLGVPTGWQWRANYTEFGSNVDQGWYDSWFAGSPPPAPPAPPGLPNTGGGPGLSWNCADSRLKDNGQQYWTCNPKDGDLYECQGGTPQRQQCQHGCFNNGLGHDDLCASDAPGWNCANSRLRSNGQQYWTCNNGKLYRCDNAGPAVVSCPNGCHDNGLGSDDACNH